MFLLLSKLSGCPISSSFICCSLVICDSLVLFCTACPSYLLTIVYYPIYCMWSFQACQLNRWPREYPALAQGFSSAPVSQRICIDPPGSNPACGSNNPLSIHFTTQFQLKVSGPWLSRTEQQNSAEHARRSRLDSHLRTSPGLLLKSGSSFHRVLESVILC